MEWKESIVALLHLGLVIQVATFRQRTHVILHVHGRNFQSTTTLPLLIKNNN
jgi:hypothetical protein